MQYTMVVSSLQSYIMNFASSYLCSKKPPLQLLCWRNVRHVLQSLRQLGQAGGQVWGGCWLVRHGQGLELDKYD